MVDRISDESESVHLPGRLSFLFCSLKGRSHFHVSTRVHASIDAYIYLHYSTVALVPPMSTMYVWRGIT